MLSVRHHGSLRCIHCVLVNTGKGKDCPRAEEYRDENGGDNLDGEQNTPGKEREMNLSRHRKGIMLHIIWYKNRQASRRNARAERIGAQYSRDSL